MRIRATFAGLLICLLSHTHACELPPGGTVVTKADAGLTLSFRPDPAPLVTDATFALIVDVCSKTPVTALRVDAHMPEHRHGMNYQPSVKAISASRYRAEGLLLHMPGKWEFVFDVTRQGQRTRLTHASVVQ